MWYASYSSTARPGRSPSCVRSHLPIIIHTVVPNPDSDGSPLHSSERIAGLDARTHSPRYRIKSFHNEWALLRHMLLPVESQWNGSTSSLISSIHPEFSKCSFCNRLIRFNFFSKTVITASGILSVWNRTSSRDAELTALFRSLAFCSQAISVHDSPTWTIKFSGASWTNLSTHRTPNKHICEQFCALKWHPTAIFCLWMFAWNYFFKLSLTLRKEIVREVSWLSGFHRQWFGEEKSRSRFITRLMNSDKSKSEPRWWRRTRTRQTRTCCSPISIRTSGIF